MPAPKKKTTKAKVKVKDMKARKNPKGGQALKISDAARKFSW